MSKTTLIRLTAVAGMFAGAALGWAQPAKADLPKWPSTRIDCTSGMDGKTYTCVGWINQKAVIVCTSTGCVDL